MRVTWKALPFIRFKIIFQVVSENDPNVVKLEALCGVNTSYLGNAPGIIGPEGSLRNVFA
jgi:hypothetical protein